MKKQYLFILILVSIFLYGCPSDDNYNDRYYTMENQSNHSLLIKFYNKGNLLDFITTNLSENGDQYKGSFTYDNLSDKFGLPSRAYRSTDSIVIDFDNIKRQIYTIDFLNRTFSEPINRNVYRHENYEDLGKDRFLFKITEEDYNNAEDI